MGPQRFNLIGNAVELLKLLEHHDEYRIVQMSVDEVDERYDGVCVVDQVLYVVVMSVAGVSQRHHDWSRRDRQLRSLRWLFGSSYLIFILRRLWLNRGTLYLLTSFDHPFLIYYFTLFNSLKLFVTIDKGLLRRFRIWYWQQLFFLLLCSSNLFFLSFLFWSNAIASEGYWWSFLLERHGFFLHLWVYLHSESTSSCNCTLLFF